MEDPWLIYDHCLLVREWNLNLCHVNDDIVQVDVWLESLDNQ